MLSQKAINDYKRIYKKEFDEGLTDAEASEQGYHLLKLFKIISKPVPMSWQQELAAKYAKKSKRAKIKYVYVGNDSPGQKKRSEEAVRNTYNKILTIVKRRLLKKSGISN